MQGHAQPFPSDAVLFGVVSQLDARNAEIDRYHTESEEKLITATNDLETALNLLLIPEMLAVSYEAKDVAIQIVKESGNKTILARDLQKKNWLVLEC